MLLHNNSYNIFKKLYFHNFPMRLMHKSFFIVLNHRLLKVYTEKID